MVDRDTEADEDLDQPYELNLEDDQASLDQVLEEAVAYVDRTGDDEPALVDGEDESGSDREFSAESDSEESKIAGLERELAELRDFSRRTLADFDNFRKRAEREKESLSRYALFDPLKGFLEVADNIGRALSSGGSADDLKLGLEMTVRQVGELLKRHGAERIESIGRPFDPTVHEAVGRQERDDVEVPTVIEEMQAGYLLHDRLLRPAMVSVAMPVKGKKSDEPAEEADEGN